MHPLLEEFKKYLRIDWDNENLSLSSFLTAAISYLKNSGVKQPKDYYLRIDGEDIFSEHRLAVMALATHFYENRNTITPTTIKTAQIPIPYGLQSMILQLKWVDPDELSV